MKPAQAKARRERLAKVKMREWARKIPDNATLINVLAGMEKPLRRDFLHVITPHLRFKPVATEFLEVLNNG